MKRQVHNRKKRTIKRSRGFLKRLIIILLSIGLLFSILGNHNKGNEIDILIKKHTEQTTQDGNRIKQLETENAKLKETVVYQYETYQAKLADFKEHSVKQVPQQEMVVNVKPKVSEEPQVITIEEVKEEVHSKNEIKDVKPDLGTTIIVTTMVVAKGIAHYILKTPILP